LVALGVAIAALLPLDCSTVSRVPPAAPLSAPAVEAATAERLWGDSEVKDAVERAIGLDVDIPERDLSVDVTDGVVVVSGLVDTLFERERAVATIKLVDGVRAVVDLTAAAPSEELSDSVAPRASLRLSLALPDNEITVLADRGTVTLRGAVASKREAWIARQTVKRVRGALSIVDELEVSPRLARTDAEIANDIVQSMRLDPLVDDVLVYVQVQDGVAAISGTAGSVAEWRRAVDLCRVPGVRRVDTAKLDIEPWARRAWLRDDLTTKRGGGPLGPRREVRHTG